jgi:hypothetical protein
LNALPNVPSKQAMKLLSIATFVLATVASTFARDLTVSSNGEGYVERPGAQDNGISKANLILEGNGTFSVGLVGGGDYRFKGTWQQAGRDVMQLRVTSAFGKDASGSGTLDLDNRRTGPVLGKFSVSGTGRVGPFKARFTSDREAFVQVPGFTRPSLPPPPVLVNITRPGSGNLRISGRPTYRLTHAYVNLNPDGSAWINIYGDATAGYVGSWQPVGANTYKLNVRGGFANERISGAVTIGAGGRSFSRLELSGTTQGVYYSVGFDSSKY